VRKNNWISLEIGNARHAWTNWQTWSKGILAIPLLFVAIELLNGLKFYHKGCRIIYRINRRDRRILLTRIAKRDEKTYKGFNPEA